MYRRVIKPVLFSLTIEQAHHAVLLLLRIIGLIPGGRWLLRKCYAVEHPALEREVFGIRFANPIGLAAGFDPTYQSVVPFARRAIVTNSPGSASKYFVSSQSTATSLMNWKASIKRS